MIVNFVLNLCNTEWNIFTASFTMPFYCRIYARDGNDERYSLISASAHDSILVMMIQYRKCDVVAILRNIIPRDIF